MHARELVRLAGWAAANAQELIQWDSLLPEPALQQYWVVSKCRIQRWMEVLRRLQEDKGALGRTSRESSAGAEACTHTQPISSIRSRGQVGRGQRWILASLEEILLSELLSRLWAALLVAYDQHHSVQKAGPLAQSILRDHLEVRGRLLHLLLPGNEHLIPEAPRLNRLRSLVERWTDLLLGALADFVQAAPFAIEPDRVQDFAGDFSLHRPPAQRRQAWQLALRSLGKAFETGLEPISANPDLNQAIAQAVLDCLPRELSLWTLEDESIWYLQVDHYTGQLENLLGSLLADTLHS
ncbi:MAG: hypothetical protein NZ602_12480 [Thermoguttaceae bacterium]|nr:hypothetical protein [Thermoguttaceae bacterium]MDW8037298.1 hypothetical protein [Thermoguttaceae bacterium]